MTPVIVVNNPQEWKFDIADVSVISAWDYITETTYSNLKNIRVYNLCRSYRYQSYGYYVSLLAAARGHKPTPSVTTINDMKSPSVIRIVSDDLEDMIQKKLSHIQSDKFMLSIYFGRNVAKHYDQLCSHLFRLFEAPFLRGYFVCSNNVWHLHNISPISLSEVPEEHFDFITETAKEFFAGRRLSTLRLNAVRYDLAILYNEGEISPPSDKKAIDLFIKAADSLGLGTETITKDDYNRIAEFDALFIRETTSVNHHTYRFARRAEAEGLVVVDDPLSILRCTNKVYLNELLTKKQIPVPRTLTIHKGNVKTIPEGLSYPFIVKQPDSSFSRGVEKVENDGQYQTAVEKLFETSMLLIAQEFMPTPFDWRVGIFDHKPIFICKYFMAYRHWQIIKRDSTTGKITEGRFETLPLEDAPSKVVRLALKAVQFIGDGLYGVDIKEVDGTPYIIEINDNPSIDAGIEDMVAKKDLYLDIMRVFLNRIEKRKELRS